MDQFYGKGSRYLYMKEYGIDKIEVVAQNDSIFRGGVYYAVN